MRRFPFMLLALTLLTACLERMLPDHDAFSGFRDFPEARWLYSRPVVFQSDTLGDSVARGLLLLSLRHTSDYPYSNLWVEVSTADSSRRVLSCDTFDVGLADVFGRWYGSGMGASLRYTDTLSRDFRMVRGSSISVRHIMRTDTLPEIEQIGLIFVPVRQTP